MSRFRKKRGKSAPTIQTASLPDIIFMLLFFFMVVTVLRDAEIIVQVTTPEATELTSLERKSLVHYIYIGRPVERYQHIYGTSPRIQMGDAIRGLDDIALFIGEHRLRVPENQVPAITTSLRVDRDVTMGIVGDVKTELRKAEQYKVNYSTRPRIE
ncbi:MAG: biopolymer transporter ExbD [Saprospirales bacterium]|nr:MAG: biopolymer transporter ExbD [Saprospirales bacterium]